MSINQENYPPADGYNDLSGVSPLYRTLPSFNRIHSNNRRSRASLHPHNTLSPNIDPYSPDDLMTFPFKSSNMSSGRNIRPAEPGTSFRLSDQLRTQQREKRKNRNPFLREDLTSPIATEPESSSSQPSEPFSGSYRDYSPFPGRGEIFQKQKSPDKVFSETFYARVHEFLDNEGLDIVDPADYHRVINILPLPKLRETKSNGGDDDSLSEGTFEMKGVQSATQSPRLISDHICCSTLYQRRASRSQGPGEESEASEILEGRRPAKLNIFKHFKDDVNQIMLTANPIEEKDTPVLSRNNSGFYDNTPNPRSARKFNFRHLLSPEQMENKTPDEAKPINNLTKYTTNASKSFKSPLLEIKPVQFLMEFSPLHILHEEKAPSSVGSSPLLIVKATSGKKETSKSRNGAVIRKSRFQKLREFQE